MQVMSAPATLAWLVLAAAGRSTPGAEPGFPSFDEYRTILWIGDSAWKDPKRVPLVFQRLREMGINTAMVYGATGPGVMAEHQFPYYVENIVNRGLCLKYGSKFKDWEKFVTGWHKSRDQESLARDFCLDDPEWRKWARAQMQEAAKLNRDHHPIAYDIRDELSVTISANPFDFDFSPLALKGFREWLKSSYKDPAALNKEWETGFGSWDDVLPFTTDKIKNRLSSGDAAPRGNPDWQAVQAVKFDPAAARRSPTAWNFSPWADHRTYMDLSLARALDDIRAAALEIDPHTPVGIEGTQMPHAFGGYDLWRLSRALDWIEPYDIGSSREILGSFMAGKPIVTTVFESETRPAMRRLWHLLLLGDRGSIVWWSEDSIDWKSEDYALTRKARALEPVLREMTGPLARLFLRAEREADPIAIHYSQPSIQVDWLIESCEDGSTWLRRFSSYEAERNRLARVRGSFLKAFQDLGWSPVFISAEEVEKGGLAKFKVLALPGSLALSDTETKEIRKFLEGSGRAVFSDGAPGLFDGHGKLRPSSPLDDIFPPTAPGKAAFAATSTRKGAAHSRDGDIAAHGRDRLSKEPSMEWSKWIAGQVKGLPVEVTVSPQSARTAVRRFRLGKARLLAIERNIDYQMSEDLKQAGGNKNLEEPIDIEAKLARAAHVYDLREKKHLGKTDRITVHLDPWQPSLFALLDEVVPPGEVVARLLEAAGR